MSIRVHKGDLPDEADYGACVAIDTETLGLVPHRDRLCVIQLSRGDGSADVVQIGPGQVRANNIERLLADPKVTKLFHFARFDVAVLFKTFGIMAAPVYCTKIASKLARTYTDRHGLKDLTRELLEVELSKQQQSTDWGDATLTEAQLSYAASGRPLLACIAQPPRRNAQAREPLRDRRRLFRFCAHTGASRPDGLGRCGYILASIGIALACARHDFAVLACCLGNLGAACRSVLAAVAWPECNARLTQLGQIIKKSFRITLKPRTMFSRGLEEFRVGWSLGPLSQYEALQMKKSSGGTGASAGALSCADGLISLETPANTKLAWPDAATAGIDRADDGPADSTCKRCVLNVTPAALACRRLQRRHHRGPARVRGCFAAPRSPAGSLLAITLHLPRWR